MTTVKDYQVNDLGWDNPSYFQGDGVSFKPFDLCFVGCGDTPYDALEDALTQAACDGYSVDHIVNDFSQESEIPEPEDEDEYDAESQCYHYASIYIKGEDESYA